MKTNKLWEIAIFGIIIISMTNCQKEPSASFEMSRSSITIGETVNFTNTTFDGYSYEWDFGDGEITTIENPAVTFYIEGTYTITLTAYSKNWKKDDKAMATLTVLPTTDLALTIYINGTINTVDDCLIQIFTTQADWLYYTNVVVVGNTDINGQITFTGLNPNIYYVDAYKEDYSSYGYYSNWNLGYITEALVKNTVNNYNLYVEYTADKNGSKSYKIVKLEHSFPTNENSKKNIIMSKRKDNIIEIVENDLKR